MKKVIPYLKFAKALPEWKLFVEFEDGIQGEIDLNKWRSNDYFKFWNEEQNFENFRITPDRKIEWSEDIDMDPDAFYLQLIGKTFEQYASDKQLFWHSY